MENGDGLAPSGGRAARSALAWPYTQAELAGMIGGSRQSVNRMLAEFVDEGLLRFEGDELVIPRPRPARARRRAVTEQRRPLRACARAPCRDRVASGGGGPSRASRWRGGVALYRRCHGRPLRRGGGLDRAARRGDGSARVPGRRPAPRGRESSGCRSRPTRAWPATCSRPASRWRSSTSPRTRASGASTAQQTGYVPRSILAVPLLDDEDSLGVLEILDRRSGEGFALRDVELAGASSPARRRSRSARRAVERDTATLIRDGLRALAAQGAVPVSEEALRRARRSGDRSRWRPTTTRYGPLPTRSAGCAQPTRPGRAPGRPARRPHPSRRTPATGARRAMTAGLDALPAWSEPFAIESAAAALERALPLGVAGPGGGLRRAPTGAGSASPSSIRGSRRRTRRSADDSARACVVEIDGDDAAVVEDRTAIDVVGHGTACAGIVHAIAPAAELVSIRVLGPNNRAKGRAFAAAIEWVVGQGIGIANLSLSSRSEPLAGLFHELADRAYFANTLLDLCSEQRPGPVVPVALRSGRVRGRPRRRGPGGLVLQPVATGRVRGVRGRRGRGLARRWTDPGDRQLVRGAAPGRLRGADPGAPPDGHTVRGQGDPRGDGDAGYRLGGGQGRTAGALGRRRRFVGPGAGGRRSAWGRYELVSGRRPSRASSPPCPGPIPGGGGRTVKSSGDGLPCPSTCVVGGEQPLALGVGVVDELTLRERDLLVHVDLLTPSRCSRLKCAHCRVAAQCLRYRLRPAHCQLRHTLRSGNRLRRVARRSWLAQVAQRGLVDAGQARQVGSRRPGKAFGHLREQEVADLAHGHQRAKRRPRDLDQGRIGVGHDIGRARAAGQRGA